MAGSSSGGRGSPEPVPDGDTVVAGLGSTDRITGSSIESGAGINTGVDSRPGSGSGTGVDGGGVTMAGGSGAGG